jgi:peptide/nickel transport system substrate-binding protein
VAGAGSVLPAFAGVQESPSAQGMTYKESPMLAEQVRAGRLPAVGQRLPENPRVIKPLERAGQFGGTWRRAYKGVSDNVGPSKLLEERLIEWDAPNPNTLGLVPNAVESWEQNADASEFTFHYRKGLKWSDGTPVTMEDMRFFFEDWQWNPELVPNPNDGVRQRVNNEWVFATPEYVSDTTLKLKFAAPYPLLPIFIAKSGQSFGSGPAYLAPAHYLKQYHPKYTSIDDLNRKAAELKVAGWQELWSPADGRGAATWWFTQPNVPVLTPWRVTAPSPADPMVMERNPFYWQVDAEGNQLPYIDRVEHVFFENQEVFNLWIAQGKIDMQSRHVGAGSYTFYKENEAAGRYRVLNWRSASTNAYFPNQGCEDPVLASLFQTPAFREALNLAINRQEINEVVWNGLGKPRQASPIMGSPEFDPEHETKWAQYDPNRANQLLDGLGLARGGDGMRRRPDGRPLEFVVEHSTSPGDPGNDQHEFVRRYWEAVGIKATMRYVERSLYDTHARDGVMDVGYWGFDRLSVIKADPHRWTGRIQDGPWAPTWANWFYNTQYKKVEPPADHPIRRIWQLWDQVQIEPDEATRNAYFQQLLDIHKQAPNVVGIVGEMVSPLVASVNFRNVAGGYIADDTLRDYGLINPQQFFMQRG